MTHANLLTPPTHLPVDPGSGSLEAGAAPETVAAAHPDSLDAWSRLARAALADGRAVDAYAYARTGYHRGLDGLRRAGWRGSGPVPWAHEPNRGFLRALYVLGEAADELDESDEADRCRIFLRECDPAAPDALAAGDAAIG